MGNEPVLADVGALGESAFHHEPAERPLQSTEEKDRDKPRTEFLPDPTPQQEPETRQGEGKTDQATPEPMDIFPPEAAAELGEGHIGTELLEFREMLIEIKLALPVGFVQRRQYAADRFPFSDGEAGFG